MKIYIDLWNGQKSHTCQPNDKFVDVIIRFFEARPNQDINEWESFNQRVDGHPLILKDEKKTLKELKIEEGSVLTGNKASKSTAQAIKNQPNEKMAEKTPGELNYQLIFGTKSHSMILEDDATFIDLKKWCTDNILQGNIELFKVNDKWAVLSDNIKPYINEKIEAFKNGGEDGKFFIKDILFWLFSTNKQKFKNKYLFFSKKIYRKSILYSFL